MAQNAVDLDQSARVSKRENGFALDFQANPGRAHSGPCGPNSPLESRLAVLEIFNLPYISPQEIELARRISVPRRERRASGSALRLAERCNHHHTPIASR